MLRRTRAPKCRICKWVTIPATAKPGLCPDCQVVVGGYVDELLTRNGIYHLTCSWKPCLNNFFVLTWRSPAYCGVNCKMKAYRRRKKRARAARKDRAEEVARLLGTSRERPILPTLPPLDESAQTGTD